MRYYLDTNILVFLYSQGADGIAPDILELIQDYETLLYTSSICVQELIHLVQIEKIRPMKGSSDVMTWLKNTGVRIQSVTEYHLNAYESLPMVADHRDPFDRLIIAQAISDRIPVISSDNKFSLYTRYGLEFIYNKR